VKIWTLIWRLLRRDVAAGEVRVLIVAMLIAVASVTTVGFFTDRVRQGLELQANELLGADLAIATVEPPNPVWRSQATAARLRYGETAEFPSMVGAGERFELASVKAVEADYPLRGTLRIATALFGADAPASGGPAPGSVWLESRLMSALGVAVGDQVTLGAHPLRVSAVLVSEPARAAGSLFSIAPRALMRQEDLAATGLISAGSRVRYSALIAGPADQVAAFRQRVMPALAPGQRIQGIDEARPEVRNALDRAGRFLGLAALASVILASVAVAMATRRFASRHLDSCAVMRCLGASQATISRVFLGEIALLGSGGALLGVAVGYLGQMGLTGLLERVAEAQLPAPSLWPGLLGLATGWVVLVGFAAPPLLRLRDVPTLRVLRRELGALPRRGWLAALLGLLTTGLLLVLQAGDVRLGLYTLIGAILTVLALAVTARLLVAALRRSAGFGGVAWRFGVSNLARRAQGSVVQIVAFGLGIMAILLLSVVRADLLSDWLDKLPPETPNRFLINVQPDQVDALQRFLQAQLGSATPLLPMVRGRLVAVNGADIGPQSFAQERAKRLVEREFNLSWATELAADNRIVAGQWWSASAEPQFSVEEGLAKDLGIHVGDQLRFRIADGQVEARVSSLRKVDWDSFRANFFVISPPDMLDKYPATFISSFFLPADRAPVLNELLRTFPNITVIDVAAVMEQVRGIITRVADAVQYVFLSTLAAGLIVLHAAIQSTLDERIHEAAVLRTLGARRAQVWQGLVAEFGILGVLAGAIAALAASLVGFVLAERIFELPYHFSPSLWIIGMVGGGVGVGVAGLLGTRHIVRQPPLATLRSAG
jgi:putative ABC transport system permease protein